MELTAKYFPAKYRGNTSSTNYNEFIRAICDDVATVTKDINKHKTELANYNKMMLLQFAYLQREYNTLLADYHALQSQYNSVVAGSTTSVYINYYDTSVVSYGGYPSYPLIGSADRCTTDSRFGLLTAHEADSISRIYLYDDITGGTYLPVSMNNYYTTENGEVLIRLSDRNYSELSMNSIKYALDGREDTYWFMDIKYSTPVDYIDVLIDIPLPLDSISTLNSNYIIVEPLPVFATEIRGVWYSYDDRATVLINAAANTNSDGITDMTSSVVNWQSADIDVSPNSYHARRNYDSKFIFPTKQFNAIRIALRANCYTIDGGLRNFYIGLRTLDCGYTDYTAGKALTSLSLTSNSYKLVYDPADTNNTLVKYKLYYSNGLGDIVKYDFNRELPAGINNIFIETQFDTSTYIDLLNIRYDVW